MENPDGTTSFELIRTLEKGDHFGEISLIRNVRRTLAVRSSTAHTQLFSLTRSTFNRILGSIKQFLKEDYVATIAPGTENSQGTNNDDIDKEDLDDSCCGDGNNDLQDIMDENSFHSYQNIESISKGGGGGTKQQNMAAALGMSESGVGASSSNNLALISLVAVEEAASSNTHKSQKLFGIKEQEEFEDPLNNVV